MLGESLEYKGNIYEFITLDCTINVPKEVRSNIQRQFLEMVYKSQKRKKLKGQDFEGLAKTAGFAVVGSYAGIHIRSELDINGIEGIVNYSLIVTPSVLSENFMERN